MSKKGGNNTESDSYTLVDSRIVLTIVICVLASVIFMLGLILFGIEVSQKYLDALKISTSTTQTEKITDIISVRYETKTYSYNPGIDVGVDFSGTAGSSFSELLKKVGGENGYYLIKSNTEYEDVINKIKMFQSREGLENFELDEDFFYSGSVILIASEKRGLSYFGINSITRDDDYNIHIDTSSLDANDTIDVQGKAILIKIENIQPKRVVITEREE